MKIQDLYKLAKRHRDSSLHPHEIELVAKEYLTGKGWNFGEASSSELVHSLLGECISLEFQLYAAKEN